MGKGVSFLLYIFSRKKSTERTPNKGDGYGRRQNISKICKKITDLSDFITLYLAILMQCVYNKNVKNLQKRESGCYDKL